MDKYKPTLLPSWKTYELILECKRVRQDLFTTPTLDVVSGFVPLANNVIRFDSVAEPFSMKVIRSDAYPESLSVRYIKNPSLLVRSAKNTGRKEICSEQFFYCIADLSICRSFLIAGYHLPDHFSRVDQKKRRY